MSWLLPLLNNLNYWTVLLLMFIEGSVIPAPSELIVPPAAYRAAAGELNIVLVVVVATIGAVLGSTANYAAAYYLGRPVVYRFANSRLGHLCLINQEKIEKAEKYFYDHGVIATLTGRLLPGIRQIISIPAGLSKMKFWKFILYTTVGAGIWNTVLAALGWYLHSFVPKEELYNKMIQSLQVAKIDIQKQLSVYGMSSIYDKKIFKTNINKAENYELLVPDAATALNVIALLEKNGISNVQVNRKEYSQSDRVLQLLREKALKKAKYEAESLMKVVGQGIGKVLSIQEYNHTYLKGSAMYMKAAELDVAERSYTPDFSPIQLQTEFSVVFEIK